MTSVRHQLRRSLSWMLMAATGIAATFPQAALSNAGLSCDSASFSFPNISGATLIDIKAEPISNHSTFSLLPGTDVVGRYTINFCNVTVSYGHLGWNDTISASVWLPLVGWNDRMLGLGGGGYSGTFGSMYYTAAVAQRFVAIGTDAGHTAGLETSSDPNSWALTSEGNTNYHLIQDFGSRSLGELSTIGKHIVEEFYGTRPRSSYFTGCSGGGRQAFELAQSYPDAFDGLIASAPAIMLDFSIPVAYFAGQLMNTHHHYPSPCEVRAFTKAAIKACDKLDVVEDNIISAPKYCAFTAYDVVGQKYSCEDNGTYIFSNDSARIIQAAWTGPRSKTFSYPPYNKDADLTSAVITTECYDFQTNCTRLVATSIFQYFLAKDANFDLEAITLDQYYSYLDLSHAEWAQILSSANPNLEAFKAAGGKLISWHGLAGSILPPGGTAAYYDKVLQLNENTMDFYRHFEAPGVGHCYGGNGPLPSGALQALMAWVENGTAPDRLIAYSATTGIERPLCPYPSRQIYTGGNANKISSFACTPLDSV